jgi:hypothetical protein
MYLPGPGSFGDSEAAVSITYGLRTVRSWPYKHVCDNRKQMHRKQVSIYTAKSLHVRDCKGGTYLHKQTDSHRYLIFGRYKCM